MALGAEAWTVHLPRQWKHGIRTLGAVLVVTVIVGGLLVASGCFGRERWPVQDLQLEQFTITKERNSQVISLRVPSRSVNSAVWPRVRVMEYAHGVLVVTCVREYAHLTDLGVFTNEELAPGQRVVVLLRDEQDQLRLVETVTVQDADGAAMLRKTPQAAPAQVPPSTP